MESFLTIRLINVLHIPIVILFWTKATPVRDGAFFWRK